MRSSCSATANLWAVVDAAALEQAVGHLIQNAVEASSPDAAGYGSRGPSGPARSGSPSPITARGMDGDFVRNRLFQPFASTKPGGFGIGVVRSALADRRDGRPAGRRQQRPAPAATSPSTSPRPTKPRNRNGKSHDRPDELPVLLIVEDDEGLQRQLKWAYEGYEWSSPATAPPRSRRCGCTSRRWSRSTSAFRPTPTAPPKASRR